MINNPPATPAPDESTVTTDAPAHPAPRTVPQTQASEETRPNRHIRYNVNIDTQSPSRPRTSANLPNRPEGDASHRPFSPSTARRRSTRAATFKTVDGSDELEVGIDLPFNARPGWQPGSEPGYDPQLPDGGHASIQAPNAACEITVVDYSSDSMSKRHFGNEGFIEYLRRPKEDWAKCRWININGLSWDVIQAVGTEKGLHKLAIEDIMNIRNRTKADWYPNHAFIIMTLQKLVHIMDDDDASSSSSSSKSGNKISAVKKLFAASSLMNGPENVDPEKRKGSSEPFPDLVETSMLRTLQRYHAGGNEMRTEFMEAHSSLAPYNMAIAAEQVSIFLTSDNTVISFFEGSASDVERPIVTRLSTPGTVLREACDASMLVQAIMDAIIDLAMPLTSAYTDILGDLELDVITSPNIKQSKRLYICISEINKMLRFLLPIDNLVNVLRDHRTTLTQAQAVQELENPASGVIVTPMTHTYLGDVLDHCIITTESLQQLKQSSENLINLIFNTITANQNESMKQLTTVTIIFLPLTFITGFFGQNFDEEQFKEIHNGIWYFWACAVPTVIATILVLMREMIYGWVVSFAQRRHLLSLRKKKFRRKRTSQ